MVRRGATDAARARDGGRVIYLYFFLGVLVGWLTLLIAVLVGWVEFK